MSTPSHWHPRGLAPRLLLLLLAVAPNAVATDESAATAARRYELGRAAFEGGRFAEAALEFEAAFEAVPHAVSLFMAADAWERAGRLEQAADVWSGVTSAPGVTPEQKLRAEERSRTLERLLGTVIITSSAPATVRLDEGAPRRTPARLHGAAGMRTLVAVVGDQEQRRTLRLQSGQIIEVELAPLRAPAAAPAEVTPATELAAAPQHGAWWTTQRWVGVALIGTGVAAAGVGAGFGVAAMNTKDDFDKAPTLELREQGLNQVRWANVGLIGGGLLSLTGMGFLLWAPSVSTESGQARLRASVSTEALGVSVEGRF